MPKKIIVSSLVLLGFCNLFCQDKIEFKKYYLQFSTGYSIPVSRSNIGSPLDQVGSLLYNFDGTNLSVKNPVNSRGAGTTLRGSFGYYFNENVILDLSFSFLRSSRILDAEQNTVNEYGFEYYARQESYSNILRLNPSIVITGYRGKKWIPYVKAGVLLPFVGKTIAEIELRDETGRLAKELLPVIDPGLGNALSNIPDSIPVYVNSNLKATSSGAFSVGFTGGFGMEYNLNTRWSVIAEIEFNMIRIKTDNTKVNTFTATGNAEIPGFPVPIEVSYDMEDVPEIIRNTVYVNELTETSNNSFDINSPNYDRDAPREDLEFRDNYNNIGLFVGVIYKFYKKK